MAARSRLGLLALWAACCAAGCTASPAAPPALVQVVDLPKLDAELGKLKGRPVVVNFWAMWCPPCVEELPDLLASWRAAKSRGIELVLISYDLMMPNASQEKVLPRLREFLAKRGIDVPVLVFDDEDYDDINERFGLQGGVPVTLVLDKQGNIVHRHEEAAERAQFDEFMRKASGG